MFLVWRGRMTIEFLDRAVELAEGDLCVVPRGIEHRTMATAPVTAVPLLPPQTGPVCRQAGLRPFQLRGFSSSAPRPAEANDP